MLQKYRGHILVTGLVALLFLLSGCGTLGLANGSTTPTQTLQNSAKAMSELKSVHFDLQALLDLQSASSSNGAANGLSFNVTGHGDAAMPDQVSATFSLGQNPVLNVITTGGKIYVQGQNGKWFVMDQSQVTDGAQKIFSQDLSKQLAVIMAQLQNAKLTDHGQEVVKGESLDHITATLDATTLQSLTVQFNGLLPAAQQSTQNQISQATLDLWIDQSTWYVHQAALNVGVRVDLSKVPNLNFNGQKVDMPSGVVPITLKGQLNFSKFNQPMNIQAPAQAEPFTQQ